LQALRGSRLPENSTELLGQVADVSAAFRSAALAAGYAKDTVEDAVYALYAAIDEAVLASPARFRRAWEAQPLQLKEFGDQLAGEHFFDRLEEIRKRSTSHAEVAEVYHLCLMLGFKGRHALEDADKLRYLTTTLGSDVAHSRESAGGISRRGVKPDVPGFGLRRLASGWMVAGILTCGVALAVSSFRLAGNRQTQPLTSDHALVQVPAKVARLKITLP
jgi:type VI secretion system protein ImpK